MKQSELRSRLLTDHNTGITYILRNNGEAVADRLRSIDYNVDDVDGALEAIQDLVQKKDWPNLKFVLSVPIRMENITSDELLLVKDVATSHARAYRRNN